MTILKDAWDALHKVVALVDDYERHAAEIQALREQQRDLDRRLLRIEAALNFAAQRRNLPPLFP